jgi:hypothetical protein
MRSGACSIILKLFHRFAGYCSCTRQHSITSSVLYILDFISDSALDWLQSRDVFLSSLFNDASPKLAFVTLKLYFAMFVSAYVVRVSFSNG